MRRKLFVLISLFLCGWAIVVDSAYFLMEIDYPNGLPIWENACLYVLPYVISIVCVFIIMYRLIKEWNINKNKIEK